MWLTLMVQTLIAEPHSCWCTTMRSILKWVPTLGLEALHAQCLGLLKAVIC